MDDTGTTRIADIVSVYDDMPFVRRYEIAKWRLIRSTDEFRSFMAQIRFRSLLS